MGSGASSQSNKESISKGNAEILRAKCDASSNCRALEEEVRWLKGKLEEEKREKEWLMTTIGPRIKPVPLHETSAEEEKLFWLRKALHAEKHEKEWLMTRYERLENELQVATDECILLRSQIAGITGVTLPETSSVVKASMPRQPLAKVDAKEEQKTSLKARRGLALGVDTGKKGTCPPVNDVPAQQVDAKEHKADQKSMQALSTSGDVTAVSSEPTLLLKGISDCFNDDDELGFSRRSSEPCFKSDAESKLWGKRMTVGLRRAKTVSFSKKVLNVEPLKLEVVDCPSSPKRKHFRRGASFNSDGD